MADSFEERNSRRRRQHIPAPQHALLIIRAMWRNLWWILLLMIAAAAAFSFWSVKAGEKKASASFELLYEQAYEGLNPNGTRFNIYELLSDDVLDETIERAGLTGEVERSDLLDSLAIRASGSQKANDMYIATEYRVTLDGSSLPKRISAESMLSLLMETFKQYFLENNGTDDSVLDIDWSDAHDLEYLEFASLVDIKAGNLINYLDGLQSESGMSQYRIIGESFHSLSESIASFRDIYVNKFTSFVTINHLFRDPDSYRGKLEYQRFLTEEDMKNSQDLYDIHQDALKMYDESMITFVMVPMYDSSSGLYMARTSIGMDNLTEKSEGFVNALDVSSKELKTLDSRIAATKKAETDKSKHDTAEQMIDEIQQHLDELIARIRTAKKDYEDYRAKNSVRFSISHPGLVSAYNLKGAVTVAFGVFLLFVIIFAIKTYRRWEVMS